MQWGADVRLLPQLEVGFEHSLPHIFHQGCWGPTHSVHCAAGGRGGGGGHAAATIGGSIVGPLRQERFELKSKASLLLLLL